MRYDVTGLHVATADKWIQLLKKTPFSVRKSLHTVFMMLSVHSDYVTCALKCVFLVLRAPRMIFTV